MTASRRSRRPISPRILRSFNVPAVTGARRQRPDRAYRRRREISQARRRLQPEGVSRRPGRPRSAVQQVQRRLQRRPTQLHQRLTDCAAAGAILAQRDCRIHELPAAATGWPSRPEASPSALAGQEAEVARPWLPRRQTRSLERSERRPVAFLSGRLLKSDRDFRFDRWRRLLRSVPPGTSC